MPKRGEEFAQLVSGLLKQNKEYPMHAVAARMGLSYDALAKRTLNKTLFSADEIRALMRAVPDIALPLHLLDGTAHLPIARGDAGQEPDRGVLRSQAVLTLMEVIDVIRFIEFQLKQEHLDHASRAKLKREIDEAESAIAALRNLVSKNG